MYQGRSPEAIFEDAVLELHEEIRSALAQRCGNSALYTGKCRETLTLWLGHLEAFIVDGTPLPIRKSFSLCPTVSIALICFKA